MSELPSGTVTFLFTDLEGSTRLWEEYPDAMHAALARHDEVLRDAVVAHEGHVVKTTGDGIHAAFATAHDALSAAVAMQLGLRAEFFDETGPLRLRMGVHTCEAEYRDGDYFGTEVNRAARVMAVAHGGQVVCTRVVEELVRGEFDVVELGEHRLRDLSGSLRLFQVDIPGVRETYPPLRSLDAYRSNLPFELSSFIGREREQLDIEELLLSSRVVSIVGVGGVGKTRLALHVGSELLPRYADGVWVCELATVLDPNDLQDAIAAALRFTPPAGVSAALGLQGFLEHKDLLLILDNCEHLVGAVASFVTETTTHASGISVLATSREALGIRGESAAPLPSLSLPTGDDPDAVLGSEAGALFVARARDVAGNLIVDEQSAASIRALCSRLDGIPLALELAAAQSAVMSPSDIERRLDKQFRFAAAGRHVALERHQTLRAAIDWSYELLSSAAAALLNRLSVPVGGFDLDAADAMASDIANEHEDAFDLLRELVTKSLVERYDSHGATRYRLLEMIRQYAAEQLRDSEDAAEARNLHAAHYLARAVHLVGRVRSADEYEALDALELETLNIAAGARWLVSEGRQAEVLKFFGDLGFLDFFVFPTVTLDELGGVAEDVIEHDGASALDGFAEACTLAGFRVYVQGDTDRYRHVADLARSPTGAPSVASLICDSMLAMFDGNLESSSSISGQAVEGARAQGHPFLLAWTLAHHSVQESVWEISTDSYGQSDALTHAEEALALAQQQPGTSARFYPLLATITANQHCDPTRAVQAADEMAKLDRTQRRWWSTTAISAVMSVDDANVAERLSTIRAVLAEYHDHGERFMFSNTLVGTAEMHARTLPLLAIDTAAIAESRAIAPNATFGARPAMTRLADEYPAETAAAKARAAAMTYDDAVQYILALFDRTISEHDQPPADEETSIPG